MAACKFLSGENQRPTTSAEARALIGKKVKYLREQDIDKTGRGYFFPQTGKVVGVDRRRIELEGGELFSMTNLKELIVLEGK
jgi:hypothetical protein